MNINKIISVLNINLKDIDPKNILICFLSLLLIINFFFGQNTEINYDVNEIKALHEKTDKLITENDSLKKQNIKINTYIKAIYNKINNNSKELEKTKLELNHLKNKKSENNNYVNRLSNNGVADEFSKYLDKRTQSNSSNR